MFMLKQPIITTVHTPNSLGILLKIIAQITSWLQCIFRPHKMAERSRKSWKNPTSIPIEVIFLYSGYGLDHRISYRIECHRQTNTANILFIKTRIYLKMDLVQFCALLLLCIIVTHVNQSVSSSSARLSSFVAWI